jgi:hypothetical protein
MMGALRSSSSSKAGSSFCQDSTSTLLTTALRTVRTNRFTCLHQQHVQPLLCCSFAASKDSTAQRQYSANAAAAAVQAYHQLHHITTSRVMHAACDDCRSSVSWPCICGICQTEVNSAVAAFASNLCYSAAAHKLPSASNCCHDLSYCCICALSHVAAHHQSPWPWK